jgi:hypothetical protein
MSKKDNKPHTKIIEKIKKIYTNFGLNIDSMEEEEMARVVEHYTKNKQNLEEDYIKSLDLKGKFREEDLI